MLVGSIIGILSLLKLYMPYYLLTKSMSNTTKVPTSIINVVAVLYFPVLYFPVDGRCTSTIHYALLDEQVRRARSDDGRL